MSLPYYKRYPRDFLEGTVGLTFEEKGAYAVVLDLIYMHDGRLTDEPRFIAGQLNCSVRQWKKLRQSLVEKGKINAELGIISNFRADFETESSRSFQQKQRENRANPNKNSELPSPKDHQKATNQNQNQNHISTPVPTNVGTPPHAKAKRGTRLSDDWEPSHEERAFALEAGLTEQEIDDGAREFRNYWCARSRDATKLRWDLTWQNRVGELVNRKRERHERLASKARPGGGGPTVTDFASLIAKRRGYVRE